MIVQTDTSGVAQPQSPEQATLSRLADSLLWYRAKSTLNKNWYQRLRFMTVLSAAVIPVLSTNSEIAFGHQAAACLGVLIAVVEGLQQLKQFHENWVNYRATEEALTHEQYLYWAKAGPFRAADAPTQLLAERVEALLGSEETKWMNVQSASGSVKSA